MTYWKPTMPLAWSAAEMEGILADALSVLAQVGVECAHELTRLRLAGWPGASISGERVRFAPAPVRDHVEQMRARHALAPRAPEPPFSLGNCWAGLAYCDPETQAIRPAAERDVIGMVRRFCEMYVFPEIFRHWNLGRWRDEGEPEVLAEAWARAQAEIASSTFRLPEAQHREVDRIYQRAARRITGT